MRGRVTAPGNETERRPPQDSLAARLSSGVAAAARRSLPDTWPYAGEDLRAPAVRELVTVLYGVRKVRGLTAGKVAESIRLLSAELSGHRPLMLAALFAADQIPLLLPEMGGRTGADPVDGWLGACWIAEAAWAALQAPLTDPHYAEGDRGLLVPLAARCRFLALTEPMRWRADPGSPWLSGGDDTDPPATRAFGNDSWNVLVGRAREARRVWSGCLDSYQSHAYLSQVRPAELEQELRALTFRHAHGTPLGLSVQPLGERARLTPEDSAVIDEVTDRHLLPRFDLRSVAALACYDDRPRRGLARLLLGGAATGAGLAAVVCAACLLAVPATALAFACYGLIICGVICFGTRWAAPWLLRLPAAAAVGVIALVGFLPSAWLRTTPHAGLLAVLALAAAACGYLVVEARSHGVGGRSLLRSLTVAAVGAVHALMVSLIGLVAVAPAFVSGGKALAGVWRHPGYGHAGMVLLLSTAWCLAVGVFSQILWDDRPITAPLAHLSWRSGR